MPRYFFDFRRGAYESKDDEGIELNGFEEVEAHAMLSLPNLAKMSGGKEREFEIEVKDESRRPVLRVRLSLTVEMLVEP